MEEGVSLWTRCKARNWEICSCGGRGHLSAMDEGKSRQNQYSRGRGRMGRKMKALVT